MKIKVINGCNINMLGVREPDIYGTTSYKDLLSMVEEYCIKKGVSVSFYQSNHEGDLVDEIQACYGIYDGIVINPGAYTHTSIALLDAVKAVSIPTVEVHISNPDERDDFRKVSFIRSACVRTIMGHGLEGYNEAIDFLCEEYSN